MNRRCPICSRLIKISSKEKAENTPFFPFCSQRCKLIDLGDWLDGRYKVVSEIPSQPNNQQPEIDSTDPPARNKDNIEK
ncbi:MAG TPA: DNA gyrase inhibitor YacG [Sedimentisphaerales bacterium]|nr:DNA gyrase inhibitor YacG [Sedimentisphaerales bacterium]